MFGIYQLWVNIVSFFFIARSNCEEGAVRLVNGSISQQGRIEVCHNNIWGSICGTGFNYTDAYVVCKELDLGVSGQYSILLNYW